MLGREIIVGLLFEGRKGVIRGWCAFSFLFLSDLALS